MKKLLLLGSLALSMSVMAQSNHRTVQQESVTQIKSLRNSATTAARINGAQHQTQAITCGDTLSYPYAKQSLLFGTGWQSNFTGFTVWQSDAEAVSQTFLHSGGSATITGVEFLGAFRANMGTTSTTARASIYSVNASNNPTTLLGSGTTVLTSTVTAFHYITLTAPVTVTGNYAVVLEATNANGVLYFFGNSGDVGETMDENLSRYKSAYYPQSAGAWVNIPTLTNDVVNFAQQLDFEPIVGPIVSYNINTAFTMTPNPVCAGSAATIANTTTPAGILQNRMYNAGVFFNHFNLQPQDSLYVWDMGDSSPLIWDVNTSYTYSAAGTYTVEMATLGGLFNSCVDIVSSTFTVNAAPSNAFTFSGGNTFCASGANPVPTATSPGGTWTGSMGLVLANGATGEIDLVSTPVGTYTLTYAAAGACASGSSNQVVTVTSAPDAGFTYASAAYCSNTTNPAATLDPGASAGTFSSSAGLNFVSTSTGEINLATSTAGTYTVTNNIAASGGCPAASDTYVVTVYAAPAVTHPSVPAMCSNDADITLTGASPAGGTYSGTGVTGSTFDPSVGTQTLTYNYTDANSCSGSAAVLITVNTNPTVTYSGLPATVCVNDGDITLTGGSPAGGSYTGTGVTAGNFSPAAAGAGTYTITYTFNDANNCSGAATASIMVDPCIGLKDLATTGAIALYPNPASQQVSFDLNIQSGETEITIYSAEGKIVYQSKFAGSKGTIDVSTLDRSIYFVRAKSNTTEVITKLVLN